MVIERREVVESGFIALLVPHRAGDTVPRTQWNAQGRVLTVDHAHGQVECIRCECRASDVQTPLQLERP